MLVRPAGHMTSPLPESWIACALAPPRALGGALGRACLRVEPEDFVVEEDLGFAPSGVGSHALLRVRKRNANTEWVARELARAAGCRPGDVGYAGLKDRHAIATQWFSLPLPRGTLGSAPDAVTRALSDLAAIRHTDYEVLEAHAHTKKLPRGALAGNRFTIRLRDFNVPDTQVADRLNAIATHGVPNYFGPQRFGRDASNLKKITPDLRAIPQREQTYVLSAARSLIFNAVLAARVADGSWSTLEPGDVANLDARGSVFAVDAVDEQLQQRMAALDIHPTGPLWGRDELMSQGRIRTLEYDIASVYDDPCALVIAAGMRQERRALRLAVRDLTSTRQSADLTLRFWLTKGSFATTVLRELVEDGAADYE